MATGQTGGNIFSDIVPNAIMVITRPVEFYRQMPKKGGFGAPLVFMVACGVAAGLVRSVLAMVGFGPPMGVGMALASIITMPIFIGVFGFVGAAVVFVIWKIIGSGEDYETAYRCLAYSGAIMPITTLAQVIPYIGVVVAMAWGTYLIICASTEVHGIAAQKSRMVFGIIAAILLLMALSAERSGREMMKNMSSLEHHMQQMQQQMESGEMEPEEAGRMMKEFIKGIEEGNGQNQ